MNYENLFTRPTPLPGERWRHCKGTLYTILGMAQHTEEVIPLVLYRVAESADAPIWARPLGMFMDHHTNGAWRFEQVPPAVVGIPPVPFTPEEGEKLGEILTETGGSAEALTKVVGVLKLWPSCHVSADGILLGAEEAPQSL